MYKHGHADAQCQVAFMYDQGLGDVCNEQSSASKVLLWYTHAANQHHSHAQYNLGMIYEKRKQNIKAMEWYQRAANQNHANAQYNLSAMHERLIQQSEENNTKEQHLHNNTMAFYLKK